VLRAGKLFLDCGIMNTIHQHDRPFSDSPLVQQSFFAYESAADFGLDAGWLLPFLPFYTKLGFGIFNGQVFGHAHGAGTPKPFPLLLGTLRSFFEIGEGLGLRLGLNALIRPLAEGEPGQRAGYLGIDFICKYLDFGPVRLAASGELWRRERTDNDQLAWGYYLLLDSRIGASRFWALGTRYDWLKTVEPVAVRPETAWSLFLTLHPSEFSYQRLQYRYSDRLTQDAPEHLFTLQVSFILGAHPPHGF
jgi:hypothetical protein